LIDFGQALTDRIRVWIAKDALGAPAAFRPMPNAADPATATPIDNVTADIVGQLMPLDARVFEFLQGQGWNVFQTVSGGYSVARLAHELNVDEQSVCASMSNLWRLGCLLGELPVLAPTLAGTQVAVSSFGAVHGKAATYRLSSSVQRSGKASDRRSSRLWSLLNDRYRAPLITLRQQ
jgi:hypothetical protein